MAFSCGSPFSCLRSCRMPPPPYQQSPDSFCLLRSRLDSHPTDDLTLSGDKFKELQGVHTMPLASPHTNSRSGWAPTGRALTEPAARKTTLTHPALQLPPGRSPASGARCNRCCFLPQHCEALRYSLQLDPRPGSEDAHTRCDQPM